MDLRGLSDGVSTQHLLVSLRTDVVEALPVGLHEGLRDLTYLGLGEIVFLRDAAVTIGLSREVRRVDLVALGTCRDHILEALVLLGDLVPDILALEALVATILLIFLFDSSPSPLAPDARLLCLHALIRCFLYCLDTLLISLIFELGVFGVSRGLS